MGYAVYHVQKGTASGGGIGNHIDRVPGTEHSWAKIDPERTPLNIEYTPTKYCKMPLYEAISSRIEEGYKGKTAIRKDAVKYILHNLSGSPEDMKRIFSDPIQREDWVKDNLEFMQERYGAENILRFTLHMDEKTPHIHCVTSPITTAETTYSKKGVEGILAGEGKLTAKIMMGNPMKMRETQDLYAEKMAKYGLERGKSNKNLKHKDTKDFWKDAALQLDRAREEIGELEMEIDSLEEQKEKFEEGNESLEVEIHRLEKELGSITLADKISGRAKLIWERKQHKDELKRMEVEINKVKAVLGEKTMQNEDLQNTMATYFDKGGVNEKIAKLEKEVEYHKSQTNKARKNAYNALGYVNQEQVKKGQNYGWEIQDSKIVEIDLSERKTQQKSKGMGM